MGLKHLTIKPETGPEIIALFNPEKLGFSKSVGWKKQQAKQRDVPELQFTSSEPRALNLDLFFDTYDTPDAQKEDVRKKYTDKLLKLAMVDSGLHRPPVCELSWGVVGDLFKGVLEKLQQQFILFMEDGTPVRAKVSCTFKEWRTNKEDSQRQKPESSDVAKMRVVKRGETLSSIAAEEYLDPGQWRPIACQNHIEDPRSVAAGTVLLIPTLPYRP